MPSLTLRGDERVSIDGDLFYEFIEHDTSLPGNPLKQFSPSAPARKIGVYELPTKVTGRPIDVHSGHHLRSGYEEVGTVVAFHMTNFQRTSSRRFPVTADIEVVFQPREYDPERGEMESSFYIPRGCFRSAHPIYLQTADKKSAMHTSRGVYLRDTPNPKYRNGSPYLKLMEYDEQGFPRLFHFAYNVLRNVQDLRKKPKKKQWKRNLIYFTESQLDNWRRREFDSNLRVYGDGIDINGETRELHFEARQVGRVKKRPTLEEPILQLSSNFNMNIWDPTANKQGVVDGLFPSLVKGFHKHASAEDIHLGWIDHLTVGKSKVLRGMRRMLEVEERMVRDGMAQSRARQGILQRYTIVKKYADAGR
tara:strand:- start:2149 stop:3240 length:1092 start_codon:yes stop_codon:yes gene_type:complete